MTGIKNMENFWTKMEMTISCNPESYLRQPSLLIGFSLELPVWFSDQNFRGIFLECGWVKYIKVPTWVIPTHDIVGGGGPIQYLRMFSKISQLLSSHKFLSTCLLVLTKSENHVKA